MTTLTAVLLESTKPEELAEFYRQGFQLAEAVWVGEDHLGFQLDNLYLGFDRVKVNAGPSRRLSLWFDVAEIATTFARLVRLGATVEHVPTADESPGEILARLFDPEGNHIGLISAVPPDNALD
jgi:predicted enzyme related to lactoylglutathione lyase